MQLRTLMEALATLNLELVVGPRSQGSAADIEDLFRWRAAGLMLP